MNKDEPLQQFISAAKKIRSCLNGGFLAHAVICNYRSESGNGMGRCNCGMADLITALNKLEKSNEN